MTRTEAAELITKEFTKMRKENRTSLADMLSNIICTLERECGMLPPIKTYEFEGKTLTYNEWDEE